MHGILTRFDTAIAVAFKDDDVRNVRAMIMGPHETPYEFGFFEVCSLNEKYSAASGLTPGL